MRRLLAPALLLSLAATGAHAQGFPEMTILKGSCSEKSHIAEGKLGTDLTRNQARFFCDSVVIMPINGNPRHVLLTFAESQSHTRPQLGFAGVMEDRQMVDVQRVYLTSGKATPVDEGACKFFYKGSRITGVFCGGKIDQGDRRTVPIVAFERR